MDTPPSVFDGSIDRWLAENDRPWMKLKTDIGLRNLRKYLPGKSLRILDAGGGSGCDSIPLAQEGHHLTLVDYSPEMLKAAGESAEREGLQNNIQFHQSDVSKLDRIFEEPQFDVVLCHNVLQFVGDPKRLLSNLAGTLVPGGILSLISANRYSMPYREAFITKDLDAALLRIGSRTFRNILFDTPITEYSVDEIQEMLPGAGLAFDAHYGIRCLSDYWGDNNAKLNPEVWEKLERLEYALTDRHPYNLLARMWQIIAHHK
jgi:S-adenosylmethionine-dependent methyltransferase